MSIYSEIVKFDNKNTGGILETGEFTAMACAYNVTGNRYYRFKEGAFNRVLSGKQELPAMLWSHNGDELPLGRWTDFYDSKEGLMAKGRLDLNYSKANDVAKGIHFGSIQGVSVGVSNSDNTSKASMDKEKQLVIFTDVKLAEISICNCQAIEGARIKTFSQTCKDFGLVDKVEQTINNLQDAGFNLNEPLTIRLFEQLLRDVGDFSHSQAEEVARHFKSVTQEAKAAANALRDVGGDKPTAIDFKALQKAALNHPFFQKG